MIADIWKILGGEIRNHVTLNNIRIFLLAIMGSFVEPMLDKNSQNLCKLYECSFGQFNEHGDLFLDTYEIPKI